MDFMLQMSTDEYSFQTAQTWVGFETQSQNKETFLDNRALSFNVPVNLKLVKIFHWQGVVLKEALQVRKKIRAFAVQGKKNNNLSEK